MEDNKRRSGYKGGSKGSFGEGRKREGGFSRSGKGSFSAKGDRRHSDGDKKPFSRERKSFDGERKSFDREKKSFDGERKPFDRDRKSFDGERKPFDRDRKSFDGERKPFDREKKSFGGERKSFNRDGGSFKRNDSKSAGYKSQRPERPQRNSSSPRLDNRIEIALQTLIDVEKNGKYINLAFKSNDKLDRLEKKDRAYVMRILYGVTEKNYTLNWLLMRVLKDKRIKPWLNAILKIGTYQIFFMRIEDNEAIDQARLLCEKYVSPELCGFVTAVLSKLSENKAEYDPETYVFSSTTQRLSVTYSFPEWLIEEWMRDYGHETTMALLKSDTAERSINLRVSAGNSCDAVKDELIGCNINCEYGLLLDTISVSDTVNIEALELYRDGKITAQGIGSMLTVNVLDVKRDSEVLDACAAPGGKTFYIAEKTKNNVVSCDIHEHRVELINKGIERLGLTNVQTVCKDMTEYVDEYSNRFDRVLIDAPCSGYGMVNSKPDIKNNAVEGESNELSDIQLSIMNNCADYVKAGGVLVYSTCTVSRAENEANVKRFINEHPEFELIDISSYIPEVLNCIVEDGMVLLLPSRHNADAFFISAMRKK